MNQERLLDGKMMASDYDVDNDSDIGISFSIQYLD